jgi:adenylate cyclase
VERKLAAIIIGDVAGYSRLMGADEAGTMATWSAYRKEVIAPRIDAFKGRLIKLTGDGFFAEFPSAVGAVESAVAIQTELTKRNTELAPERRIQLRIGINLCEVLADDGDIYGDGVNIAARVEKLAEPSGICVTAAIHEQVYKRLKLAFQDIGEHSVKNIAAPVRAFRLKAGPSDALDPPARPGFFPAFSRYRWAILSGMAALLALGGLGFAWGVYKKEMRAADESESKVPAVLVLPFANLGDEKEQNYFSDGMTDDIIAALTRFPSLRVLSRHASFAQKDKDSAPDYRELTRRTGARYFLEGGVRRQRDMVRLNVQLIDGESIRPKWSERYDIPFRDIFKVQDDLTQRVVATFVSRISQSEFEKSLRKPPENLEAYELTLRGRQKFFEGSQKAITEARDYLSRAVVLDPKYAPPYVYLAYTYLAFFLNPWNAEHLNQANLKRIIDLTGEAAALDPNYAPAYTFRAVAWAFMNQHDIALQEARRGFSINPNDPESVFRFGQVLLFSGSSDEASVILQRAFSLDPSLPPQYHTVSARAYILLDRHGDAVTESRYCTERIKFLVCHLTLIVALELAGRDQEAQTAAANMMRLFPKARLSALARLYSLAYRDKSHGEHAVAALRKAGIPD